MQLFDHTILPTLLYGCEIWGFQNTNLIETVHNQFMRNITNSRKSTPLYMLYAELGRVSIDQHIKSRIVGYWISLVNGNESKLAKRIYNIINDDCSNSGILYKWINCIKQILIFVGKPDLFNQPFIYNPHATKLKISETWHDIFTQDWNTKINTSTKGRSYNLFKQDTKLECF